MAFPEILEAKRLHTRDDLREVNARPENADKRFELIDGEIIEMPAASPLHAWLILEIAFALKAFVDQYGLGIVLPDGPEFHLPDGSVFIPDISFVAGLTPSAIPPAFDRAPDLAVEVLSPSNMPREMKRKIEGYRNGGSRRVWVVYAELRSVDVYRRLEDGSIAYRTLRAGDTLSGEDVLPNFELPVARVFATAAPVQSQR